MNVPRSFVGLLVLALVAAGLAVWAGPNLVLAVPCAVAALLLAAAMVYDGWQRGSSRSRTAPGLPATLGGGDAGPSALPSFPEIGGSRFSREEIVLQLDLVERTIRNPSLPAHPLEDLDRLSTLPRRDFVEYVRRRVEELESNR